MDTIWWESTSSGDPPLVGIHLWWESTTFAWCLKGLSWHWTGDSIALECMALLPLQSLPQYISGMSPGLGTLTTVQNKTAKMVLLLLPLIQASRLNRIPEWMLLNSIWLQTYIYIFFYQGRNDLYHLQWHWMSKIAYDVFAYKWFRLT